MLEIFGIILMCANNARIVKNKGRKPGLYVALTIILWVVFEIIGIVLGMQENEDILIYILGIVFAGIGAMISLLIAKTARVNKKIPLTVAVQNPDDKSAKGITEDMALVKIVCDDPMSSMKSHNAELNLRSLKLVNSGQAIYARVSAGKSTLGVCSKNVSKKWVTHTFSVGAYDSITVHFRSENNIYSFYDESGIRESAAQQQCNSTLDTFITNNVPSSFCVKCGAKLPEGAMFCPKCGETVK